MARPLPNMDLLDMAVGEICFGATLIFVIKYIPDVARMVEATLGNISLPRHDVALL